VHDCGPLVVGVVAGVAAARPLLLWARAGPQLAVSLAACLLSGGRLSSFAGLAPALQLRDQEEGRDRARRQGQPLSGALLASIRVSPV
jgi:hypothetical protein